jgi:Protein of unknown function (DUF3048) N-terminal domain/Protein of unknown function (DUF3048) C-terminal domain
VPGWPTPATRRRPAPARLAVAVAVLGAATCGVAGCVSSVPSPIQDAGQHASQAGGQSARPAGGQSARPAQAAAPPVLAPLTGLPASAAAAARPAVALVLSGRHPAGLRSADVVFVEITAPAVRYIAVFQSMTAARVGPITSTRPADGMALSVLHPLTGYDGGSAGFREVLHSTKVVAVGYAGHRDLYRAGAGGITTSTSAIGHAAWDTAPPPLLEYQGEPGIGDRLASAGLRRVSSLRVAIPGRPAQAWRYDARARRWALVSGGPRVMTSNLIVQDVAYKQVFQSHRLGITVPSARVIGAGRMLAVSGSRSGEGQAARGTWSKPGLPAVTNFLDAHDLPMAFLPGPTWIILAPHGTRVETG